MLKNACPDDDWSDECFLSVERCGMTSDAVSDLYRNDARLPPARLHCLSWTNVGASPNVSSPLWPPSAIAAGLGYTVYTKAYSA